MDPVQFSVNIRIDEQIIRDQSTSVGPLVCPISVSLDTLCFPSADWSDFAVVILGWWLEQARELQLGRRSEAVFRFMDGPYEIGVRAIQEDSWVVQPVARDLPGTIADSYAVNGPQVVAELERASLEVVSACRAASSWSKDCEVLESLARG